MNDPIYGQINVNGKIPNHIPKYNQRDDSRMELVRWVAVSMTVTLTLTVILMILPIAHAVVVKQDEPITSFYSLNIKEENSDEIKQRQTQITFRNSDISTSTSIYATKTVIGCMKYGIITDVSKCGNIRNSAFFSAGGMIGIDKVTPKMHNKSFGRESVHLNIEVMEGGNILSNIPAIFGESHSFNKCLGWVVCSPNESNEDYPKVILNERIIIKKNDSVSLANTTVEICSNGKCQNGTHISSSNEQMHTLLSEDLIPVFKENINISGNLKQYRVSNEKLNTNSKLYEAIKVARNKRDTTKLFHQHIGVIEDMELSVKKLQTLILKLNFFRQHLRNRFLKGNPPIYGKHARTDTKTHLQEQIKHLSGVNEEGSGEDFSPVNRRFPM